MRQDLDTSFTAPLESSEAPGGWTIIVMPRSSEILGTRRPVKVRGELDGNEFTTTLLPMGNGTHMIPVKAALRRAVGKGNGESVAVRLYERMS